MHYSGPSFHYQLTSSIGVGVKILNSHIAVLPRLAPWDVSALPAPSGSGDPIQSHWWPGAGNYSLIPRKMRFKSEVDTDGVSVFLARQGWLVGWRSCSWTCGVFCGFRHLGSTINSQALDIDCINWSDFRFFAFNGFRIAFQNGDQK